MSTIPKTISKADAQRYLDALQTYLSRKRDTKAAGQELFRILVEELGVSPQRAVRMEPSSFIAGVLAANGIRSPELDEAQ